MCDTVVVFPPFSSNGKVYIAKNSAQDPNEAHYVETVQELSHPAGSFVKCTLIEIPQVQKANPALLAKPYCIWGTEGK